MWISINIREQGQKFCEDVSSDKIAIPDNKVTKCPLELIPNSYVLLALPYDIDQGIKLPQLTSIS